MEGPYVFYNCPLSLYTWAYIQKKIGPLKPTHESPQHTSRPFTTGYGPLFVQKGEGMLYVSFSEMVLSSFEVDPK